jgi:hypothetical protein
MHERGATTRQRPSGRLNVGSRERVRDDRASDDNCRDFTRTAPTGMLRAMIWTLHEPAAVPVHVRSAVNRAVTNQAWLFGTVMVRAAVGMSWNAIPEISVPWFWGVN